MKPVNLNQARKTRAKAEAKVKADANAVRFGRTKAQKMLEQTRRLQTEERLSQLKLRDD